MKKKLIEILEPLLECAVKSCGLMLYDLEFIKEGGNKVLRLYIDKEGGVNISDCENASRAAEAVLDEHDPIPAAYLLEVSSPGIERKLTKENHFIRYTGEKVFLRLFAPVNGQKKYRGNLMGIADNCIVITDDTGEELRFDRSQVSQCRLEVFNK